MQLQPISRVATFVAGVTGPGSPGPAIDVAAPQPPPPAWLLIRRLRPHDRGALAAHLLALSPEDRRNRFGANASDAAIRNHCDTLDLSETVCFAAIDPAGEVAGAALGFTYGIGTGGPCQFVEIAVSVAPRNRRRRVGADLVARVCAATGAEAAVFEFDPRNVAIQGLVRHLGGLVAPLAETCAIPLSDPARPRS